MHQLNLVPTDLDKVNLATLNKEPKGTIAIILDLEGNLQGVNQKGAVVPVMVAAGGGDSKSFSAGDAENIVKAKLSGVVKEFKDELKKARDEDSKAFTNQFKVLQDAHKKSRDEDSKAFNGELKKLQDEIKKLKPKAAAKPKAKSGK